MNCFNKWIEFFNQKPSKSTENQNEIFAGSFADRMANDYQQKQFDDTISKWNTKALQYCNEAKEKFFNILTFPTGGWMIDMFDIKENDEMDNNDVDDTMNCSNSSNESTKREDDVRLNQMIAIRKLYIPYICIILCEMFSKMGLDKELIQISDIVASEFYKLYDLFYLSQMKSLLNKIALASVQLLENNKFDFLGY